jgi:two-component system chemotaxis response regulator CheY
MPVRALIIDDSALARKVIAFHLRQIHCVVAGEASTAEEGLKVFRELQPDIVTLDLMMPDGEGHQAVDLLTTMKREMSKVVVIVITSIPFEKTRKEFLDRGAFAYLVKPLTQFSFKPLQLKLLRQFPELAAT